MKMKLNFEKFQMLHFHWKTKLKSIGISTFDFLRWYREIMRVWEAPGSMEILHFGAGITPPPLEFKIWREILAGQVIMEGL